MAITKTDFLNYTRCPRYCALDEIRTAKLMADVSYDEYSEAANQAHLEEMLAEMFENDENFKTPAETKLQLEAMLPYYREVEHQAALFVLKHWGGTVKYARVTQNQEGFDFSRSGFNYLCYVDVYNEVREQINIIEVKATTTAKYMALQAGYPKASKYSIFKKENNLIRLKDEIPDYPIDSEMPRLKYNQKKAKLFDRYGLGAYVFDLAVQRFIIEGEYRQSKNESKLKKIKYYLAILNSDYDFPGRYENGQAIYEPDAKGEELINLIDLTEVTAAYQKIVLAEATKLENYLKVCDDRKWPLGPWCGYRKKTQCPFFNSICGRQIPVQNSVLNYLNNQAGFLVAPHQRLKGLDLINAGYLNMLDIPESWIEKPNHVRQRDCLRFNQEYVNRDKLAAGLKMLQYPIYHLDFETFPCPLPRFKHEHPYYQSPFEFSLHIESQPGQCDFDRDHYVFLASDFSDQREAMIKALLAHVNPNQGTLLAQNVAFEKGRIKELAQAFPTYKTDLLKLVDRGFDLLWLVNTNVPLYTELGFSETEAKGFNYYNPRLSGSYSIKKTLPVFSDLSYDKLAIKNGTAATVVYANYPKMTKTELESNYEALKIYCKQDTWAMVVILAALRRLVK